MTAFPWNRAFQLVGLLLIAVLSVGAEATRGQDDDDEDDFDCYEFYGCDLCFFPDDIRCMGYICPIGDPRGIGITCKEEKDDAPSD